MTTPISLSIITAIKGSTQKKIIADANGKPIKDGSHSLGISEGIGEDITVNGFQGFAELLSSLKSNQALVLGQTGLGKQRIIPKDKLDGQTNTIARTKHFYHWPAGYLPLLFDHDSEPGKPDLTAEQFWSELLQVFPEFAAAGRVVTVSTSSAIYSKVTGECIKPPSGHHTYPVVTGDVERFNLLFQQRCWLKGKAFFKLAKQNQQTGVPAILERFLADTAVFSPERLVYEAGALLDADSPFEQRLPEPQVFDGDFIDLDQLPDLTADELAQSDANRKAARAEIEAQQLEQTCDRIHTEKPELGKREVKHVARQRIQSTNQCLLEPDHLLYSVDGRTFKAGEIDQTYDQLKLKDPQEPDYRGGAQTAIIFADANGWTISSRAHGGCTYRLKRATEPDYARELDQADREWWQQRWDYEREKSKQSLIDKIKGIYQRAVTPKALQVKPSSTPKPITRHSEADITYAPGERLQTWQRLREQGYRYILDISGTGEGKSFDTGNAEPKDFGVNQLIYATDQQRNPTNDTLTKENGWVGLESRHDGLVLETTVNGSTRLRRRKPSDPKPKRYDSNRLQANCNRTGLISTLRAKNVTGADSADVVCSTCPLKNACLHSDGIGKGNYGYLYQRKNAIPSPKLRSHPDSLPAPTQYDYSRSGAVWDEVSQNFSYSQKLGVIRSDIDQTIAQLAIADPILFQALLPLLKKLAEIFERKLPKHGIDCVDLVGELLPLLPADIDADAIERALQPDFSFLNTTAEYGVDLADLPPAAQRMFSEKDAEAAEKAAENVVLQWLALLIRILQKAQRGYLSVSKMKASSNPYIKAKIPVLSIWHYKPNHHAVVDAAAFNVFLDATISKERLALMLDCDPAEIVTVQQLAEQLDNLLIDQIHDCGRMSMQRGKDQQRRADAIVRHYKAVDPTTKVIDFKAFDADGAWWRDSRGVNDFLDCNTLILVGTPCPNLTELKARYTMLNGLVPSEGNGNLDDFRCFVDEDIAAEIKQAIGRLRNNRRKDTKLRVVLISNFELSIPTNKIKAKDITIEAASKTERAEQAIIDAVNQLKAAGRKVTQMAVSAITGITQSQISRDFRQLLQMLLDPPNSKSDNSELDEYIPIAESAIADSTSLQQTSEVIHEIFTNWLQTDIDRSALFDRLNHHTKTKILSILMAFTCPEDLEVMA